jgi:hypothetical protein
VETGEPSPVCPELEPSLPVDGPAEFVHEVLHLAARLRRVGRWSVVGPPDEPREPGGRRWLRRVRNHRNPGGPDRGQRRLREPWLADEHEPVVVRRHPLGDAVTIDRGDRQVVVGREGVGRGVVTDDQETELCSHETLCCLR